MPVCKECRTTEANQYFGISGTTDMVCGSCFNKDDPIQTTPYVKKSHLRIFTRWRCITHNCGSYSMNNLIRHEMETCEIVYEDTVGVVKPKTFGGHNGDVSREYFPDWKRLQNKKRDRLDKIKAWKIYSKEKQFEKDRRRKRQPNIVLTTGELRHGYKPKGLQ